MTAVALTFTRYRFLQNVTKRCSAVYHSKRQASTETSKEQIGEEFEEEMLSERREIQYDQMYSGHIPTSLFQKVLLSAGSAAMSLYNPARDDMIATLGETTGHFALTKIKQKMLDDPVGRKIIEEEPEINTDTVDIDYLGSLPEETFGKKYWNFLSKNGFSPDTRLPVHFVDDPELRYVMLRYRQTHDLFHSVLGMPPHMLGEVAVKWVEAIQTGLPMCALGAFFGPLRLGPVNRQQYINTYLPWAIRCGRNANFLMAVYWEKHWDKNLSVLQAELNIEPAPKLEKKKK